MSMGNRWGCIGCDADKSIHIRVSNIWYASAVKQAKQHFLSHELDILLITAPYFLATKIDGEFLFDEISASELELKSYLVKKFKEYQKNTYFINALPGHLSLYQTGTDERTERLEKIISKIAEI